MNTTKTPRYKKVAHQYATTREQIIHRAQITPDEYYQLEFETGTSLLDEYFKDLDPGLTRGYKRKLIHYRKYGYWLWFINQKQQAELGFKNRFTTLFGNMETPEAFRREYYAYMQAFTRQLKIHERLRAFIVQGIDIKV